MRSKSRKNQLGREERDYQKVYQWKISNEPSKIDAIREDKAEKFIDMDKYRS